MEKKRLTDGLLQIAILLSLLRSNVDEYFHILSGYNTNEHELSEILLGSTSVITQTHSHHNNWDSSLGVYVHPKNIDNFISRSVFRDLHNLGDYNQIESPTIAAYLLPALESRLRSENANSNSDEEATSDNNNNNNSPQGSTSNTGSPSLTSSQDDTIHIPLSPGIGDELSQEDMDLIEILWRQDIDMGVGKECFDVSLRRELEKEQELEEAKKKQKEEETNETATQLLELSQNVNFVVDGETGELVPALESSTPDGRPRLTSQQGLSIEDAIEILQNEHTHTTPAASTVTTPGELTSQRSYSAELESLIANLPQVPLARQASIERRWDDVQDLLGVQLDTNTSTATPLPTPPQATPVVLPYVTSPAYDVTPSSYDVTGSVAQTALLQNATLGVQAMNNTELLAAAIDTPVLPPDNDTSSLYSLNTTDTALFPNASVDNNTNFLLDLLEENNRDAPFPHSSTVFRPVKNEDPLSDSAVGSLGSSSAGSASPFHSETGSDLTSPFNITELEGATGGLEDLWSAPKDNKEASRFQFYSNPQQPTPDFLFSDQDNVSDSNSTDLAPPLAPANPRHVQHNHTYPALPGQQPKERKCDVNARMMRNRTAESRDEKKAKKLQLPFTVEEIIHSPVEQFTDMITKTKLTDPQLQLMKDIRRRGKNKVAAQNCRKRKMEVIETLEEEVERMRRERDSLSKTRGLIDKEKTKIREKYNALYREVFNSLRDENGQPYDPNHFTLQHTADGNVFLVPKNTSSHHDGPSKGKKGRKDSHKK